MVRQKKKGFSRIEFKMVYAMSSKTVNPFVLNVKIVTLLGVSVTGLLI